MKKVKHTHNRSNPCLIYSLIDLAFFYGADRVEELTKPETMTPAVKNYVSAMRDACNQDPALLIAHSYSRYLGDLSGMDCVYVLYYFIDKAR